MSFSLKELKVHQEDEEEQDIESQNEVKHHPNHPNHLTRHVHHSHSRRSYTFREPQTPKNHWNVGCFYLDKECIAYFTQMLVLFTCIAISLWKVATTTDNRDIWVSLLSSCIGIIVPNPKLKNEMPELPH